MCKKCVEKLGVEDLLKKLKSTVREDDTELVESLEERLEWFCKKCNKDCLADDKDYYMLKDDLWSTIYPEIKGMLCIGCVEELLGRKLEKDDIMICPLTVSFNPYTAKILGS